MGGNLASQVTEGVRRGQQQNNPMPPGQQGPPSPFSMLPEFEFDPQKGLNVTLSPDHLQQLLIAGMGLMKGQQPQGAPPILQPQQQQGMQQMGMIPDPNNYRRF